jgi:hypothetical protein
MYYIRIIDNWNSSQLNKYYNITLRTSVKENTNCLIIMDERRFDLSRCFCEGSEITISGSSLGNDDEYTVNFISDVYESGKYFVQIIKLNETVTSEEDFFDCTFSLTDESEFYPEIEIKNSLDLTNGIFITSDSVERFEAQKFIGDDFFMSEPREATLEFLRTSWLIDKFKTYNKSEEICNVLYYDEDGAVIEHENYDDSQDWDIGQVVTINNIEKTVYDKEIIIQQISKYVIEIHSINGDKRKKEFTGFVDKSQTKLDSSKITITINDSMKFVEVYANQLVKEIVDRDGIDNYHLFISSKNELDSMMKRINDMTKLNISLLDNDLYKYIEQNQILLNFEIDLNDVSFYPGSSILKPQNHYGGHVDFDKDIAASKLHDSLIVFKCFYCWYDYFEYQGTPNGRHKAYPVFGVIRKKIKDDGNTEYISELYRRNYTELERDFLGTYDELDNNIISKFINNYKYDEMIDGLSLEYLFENESKIAVKIMIRDVLNPNYIYIYKLEIERYGLVIPIYPDTYKYEDILRMILYVNELRFYCDNNGDLYIKELYPDEDQDDVFSVTERDILVDGYSESSVQKDYPNLSEALNPVWYDYENEGFFYKKLDITMRKIYENILIKRYPSELTCKILKRSMSTGEERNLDLHSILSCFNKFYIIVEIKENDTGFYYEVKAYELGNYNNNNIGGLFTSIGNNKLEDLNSNRFSTNKIWTDENLWIDSFGKYNEER